MIGSRRYHPHIEFRPTEAALLGFVPEQDDKAGTIPKLNAMRIHEALRLRDCFGIVRTNQRLISNEMPVVPDEIGPILDHRCCLFSRRLRAGRHKPFVHMGCRFGLPGSSDKLVALEAWVGTFRLFSKALSFFD